MNIHYAYRVASSYDYNRDGWIDTKGFNKEIGFEGRAKRLTDFNNDGHVSVHELAHSLARGDVYIGRGNKVRARFTSNPGYPSPGYPGSYPGPITYPGPGYGYGYGYSGVAAGAVVGGAIGYISNGSEGAQDGAVIGGVIGAISDIFNGF